MPRQVLDDMGQQQNIGDALRLLGVASTGYDSYLSWYSYRGFTSTTTLWNGFRIEEVTPSGGPGVGPVWMDNVERLELMRGPASILYGQVEPGGMINVITRKPQEQFHAEARFGVGSWNNRWEILDVTGPLDESKTLLARVIVSDQQSGSWFNHSSPYKSQAVAPQLEWRVTPQTTLAFEGQYRQVESETWRYSYSFNQLGQYISAPRQDSRLPDNVARWEQSRSMIGVNHRFDQNWSVSWKFLHDTANEPWAHYQSAGDADFSTLAPGVLNVGLGLIYNNANLKTSASTLDVLGHFSTWGVDHTLLTGMDMYAQEFNSSFNYVGASPTNIFDPTRARLNFGDPAWGEARDRLKHSLYLQDQVALPFGLHVLGGLRYERIREDYTYGGTASSTYRKDVVTPRFGVLWRPQPWISGYYSYSENQGQSPGFEYPGNPLKPQFSRQHEAGVKTELMDGRLNATASVFELTKENIGATDQIHPNFVIGVGKVRSTGYEFNVQGALTDDWQVLANYSFARPLVVVGSSGAFAGGYSSGAITAGELLPDVPLRNFSIWTSYRLPFWSDLTLGGGASWRSKSTPKSWSRDLVTGEAVSASAYWLASAFIRYETWIGGYNAKLQLNVDNLFDTVYSNESACYGGFGGNSCYRIYGPPRSARLELRVAF
jgi:iron complex outermembrane receptor protein